MASGEAAASSATSENESKVEIQNMDDDHDKQVEEAEKDPTLPPARDQWGSKVAYFLTLVGYAVGFGNIWRFPYQVRDNGGLVFLIPYCIMLAVVGIPVFFLELAVGQRRRKGAVYAWNEISPYFGGLGLCCGWLCFVIGLYYNTLLAYCLSYLVESFFPTLPWTDCKTAGKDMNERECVENVGGRATKYHWNKNVLGISEGVDYVGGYSWLLCLYHILAWGAIWGILWKGTESVGKVVYFTAVFPYVVLIAFFIANLCVEPEKAWLGAYRLVIPDWSLLFNPITWLKAGSQIFFSLGLALGCLVIFASYNPERNNCHRDAVLISIINCGTSVFAALVVFPIIGALGYRKYEECVNVMQKIFPQLEHLKDTDKKYDIYFSTIANTWSEVSESNPIVARYGYGELTDAQKNMLEPLRDNELFEEITDVSHSSFDMKMAPGRLIRDCSIGREATASGGGTGFVFIGFTEAVIHMPGSNFWSVIFFLMLLTLGIDSGFGTVEGAVSALEDLTHFSRLKATSIVCGVLTVLAIAIFPFGHGSYVLDLLDQWTANWSLLLIALAQCIAVAWFYGLAKIAYDVRLMTGSKPNLYMLICWKYVSPIVIILLLVGSIIKFIYDTVKSSGIKYTTFRPASPDATDGDYTTDYPSGPLSAGFLVMIFCMIWIPIHICLRKTRFNLLRDEAPADFPEEQLREERNINVAKEEDQFSQTEKIIMGRQSLLNLQEHRDQTRSQTSLQRKGSGALSLGGPS